MTIQHAPAVGDPVVVIVFANGGFPLEAGFSGVLGSSERTEDDVTLLVDNPGVGPRHAELTCKRTGLWVRDLDSPSGTWVNGRRASGRTRLDPGDVIAFGPVRATVRAVPGQGLAPLLVAVVLGIVLLVLAGTVLVW